MRHGLCIGSDKIMLLVAQMHIITLERPEDLDYCVDLDVGCSVLDDDLVGESKRCTIRCRVSWRSWLKLTNG